MQSPNKQSPTDHGLVEQCLTPREADIGGVLVRRVFPTVGRKMIGPWVFFDEMGPVNFAPGAGLNVPPHPHIGLATVTYLFAGEILHRDSIGSVQFIRPGDINLMVAGRGVVHSEREGAEAVKKERSIHGLQLWLALPEAQERCEPAFYHVASGEIPALTIAGVKVRVLMGNAYGASSPVPTFSDTLYIEAFLESGQTLSLPDAEERGLYLVDGSISLESEGPKGQQNNIEAHHLVVLKSGAGVRIRAESASRIALVGGAKLGKRHINWNFVASSRAQISAARDDWKAGRFPSIAGDDEEFVPLPE